MAPISAKASDHPAEELRLELEALNQALQYRSHTRSCKRHSVLLRHASPKHPLTPKPSFKVPSRSASPVISCDCPKGSAPSSSSNKPLHHQHSEKKGSEYSLSHERKGTHHERKGSQHSQNLEKKDTHIEKQGSEKRGTHHEKQGSEKRGTHHEKKSHQQHQSHERKSFWHWRPLRAISHLIMRSHQCLHVVFSLHVHRIEGLPVPMSGLRIIVRWLCKDHGLQTMPSRIFHGIAEFGETLRHRCKVYGTHNSNDMIRYDTKPSTLSVVALDVDELELAKHHVDLSSFLLQNNVSKKNTHGLSFELSGMAKGGTLIISVSHDLEHHYTDGIQYTAKQIKKTPVVSKSLPLSSQALPLIDLPDLPTFPPLSEPGADADLLHDREQLNLVEGHSLQHSSTENKASNVSDSGFSSSFEFKPNLDSCPADERQNEFSFMQAEDMRPARFKNSLNKEGGLLMNFPFHNAVHTCDRSNLMEDIEWKIGTQMQQGQWKPQETWGNHQDGQQVHEETMHMKVSQTESDDELDSIAEEFLNMLGIG